MSRIGNQQMLKEVNRSLIFNLIYESGPISRVELARITNLSPTTVSVLVEEGMNEGIVHEVGTSTHSGVGRKQTLLSINENHGYVLGVDLSRAPVQVVLLNFQGQIIKRDTLKRSFIGREAITLELGDALEQYIIDNKLEKESIKSIGISVPGEIDEKRETILGASYLKIKSVPLKSILNSKLHTAIHLVNDLEAAGFAEQFSGIAKGHKTIVYILIDFGVGAGIIINNQIYRGATGHAGKISDFYNYSTELIYEFLVKSDKDMFADLEIYEALNKFIDLAMEGEQLYKDKLDEAMHVIAKYCGNVLQLLNPEILVLNGWITFNETCFAQLIELIHHYHKDKKELMVVKASHWKDYGSAIGAANLGLYEVFKRKPLWI